MLPNFYTLGAQKAGTTWLYGVLQGHPELAESKVKELHFFDNKSRFALGADWYQEQFSITERTRVVADFTPNYLPLVLDPECKTHSKYPPEAALELRRLTPDAKFVVLLRDPVKRAISAYRHHLIRGRIKPFESIMDASPRLGILEFGLYWEQLEKWFELFPREQFLVRFYENAIAPDAMKQQTLQEVLKHVGLDTNYSPENLNDNFNSAGGYTYSQQKEKWDKFSRRQKLDKKILTENFFAILNRDVLAKFREPVGKADIKRLQDFYSESNQKLRENLGAQVPW